MPHPASTQSWLVPGNTCGQLDARLNDEYEPPMPGCGIRKQGRRWFRLCENFTALQEDPSLLPCYADQTRHVYDTVAGDYRLPQPAGRQDSCHVLRHHPELPLQQFCSKKRLDGRAG
ncbi:unnamed protein product [Urochloa humidicola]